MIKRFRPHNAYLFVSLTLIFALGISFGCSATGALSRPKAKALIEASDDFQRMHIVKLSNEGVKRGQDEGLWILLVIDMRLSPQAQQIFKEITGEYMKGHKATLQTPVKARVIEVKGIADATSLTGGTSQMKETEFTWDYENLPSMVRRYATQGGTGSALFRLYDDGWRIQKIKLNYSDKPITLTAAEAAEERAEQEVLEAQKAQKQDLARRSHVPTKIIAQFQMQQYLLNNDIGSSGICSITDVGIEWIPSTGGTFVAPFSCGLPTYRDRELNIYRFSNDNPLKAGPSALTLTVAIPGVRQNGMLVVNPQYDYAQLNNIDATIRSAVAEWESKYGKSYECVIPTSLTPPGTKPSAMVSSLMEEAAKAAEVKRAETAASEAEKRRLEKMLDWHFPDQVLLKTEMVVSPSPGGMGTNATLSLTSDGIRLSANNNWLVGKNNDQWQFWKISGIRMLNDRMRIRFWPKRNEFEEMDLYQPKSAETFKMILREFNSWQQSDLSRQQIQSAIQTELLPPSSAASRSGQRQDFGERADINAVVASKKQGIEPYATGKGETAPVLLAKWSKP
jgi:hypothetical protein